MLMESGPVACPETLKCLKSGARAWEATRNGFVLTDQELVAIQRRDAGGNFELADLIKWNPYLPQQRDVTVALGL